MYLTSILVVFVAIFSAWPADCDVQKSNSVRLYFQKLEKKNDTLNSVCEDCKIVVAEFGNVVKDPSKLERLKVVLKLLCDYMGGQQAQDCKNMVDNLDFLIHELAPYLNDPARFCKEIHLCGQRNVPLYGDLVLKSMKFAIRTSNADVSKYNDLLCDECVFAATEVNNMIHSTDVQNELKREIQQICKLWAKYEQKCKKAIEEYFASLIQFLESIFNDPKKFCFKIQMCSKTLDRSSKIRMPASRKEMTAQFFELTKGQLSGRMNRLMLVAPFLQTRRGYPVLCVICEFGLQSLLDEMNRNNAQISKTVSTGICKLLPEALVEDCLDFSSIYASSILKMFTDEWTPGQLCTEFDICTNQTVNSLNKLSEAERSSTSCEACHAFTEFASYELREQELQQQIIALVKAQICGVLPGDLANQCRDTADQYVPMIMQHLADYLTSAQFCKEVHMCPAARMVSNNGV